MAELVVWGVVLGSIITLGAMGLTLVFGILRFPNFAHGDLMMVGAYVGLLAATLLSSAGVAAGKLGPFSFGWPLLLALPLAALGAGLAALGVDRAVFRPLRRRRLAPVMLAMASLAMALVVRSAVFLAWGPSHRFYTQGLRTVYTLPLLEARVRADQLFILAVAVLLVAGLWYFLEKTRMGKALRATADNPDLARISGIDTERMVVWTWVLGAGLAGVAGVLLGLDSKLYPTMGWDLLLPLFAAVVLGSIGNVYGALVGAMIIGVSQQVSTLWLEQATYKAVVAFLILILTLLVRPTGLFGSRHAA